MSNVATVSFKVAPEHYAVLKALAEGEGITISQLVRQTVQSELDLDRKVERLAALFAAEGQPL